MKLLFKRLLAGVSLGGYLLLASFLLLTEAAQAKITVHTPLQTIEVDSFAEGAALFVQVVPLLKALHLKYSFKEKTIKVEGEREATVGQDRGRKGVQIIFFTSPMLLKDGSLFMEMTDLMRWLDLSGTVDTDSGEAFLYGKVISFTRQEIDGGVVFALKASAPFAITPRFFTSPFRYVIDASPLIFSSATRKESVGIGHFLQLRISQFHAHPNWIVRLVLDEDHPVTPLLYWDDDKKTLVVGLFHQVEGIKWQADENGMKVSISFTGNLSVSTFPLSQPHRVVVDLSPAVLGREKETIEVGEGRIDRIRIAQFQTSPSVVRVVLDLNAPTQYSVDPDLNKVVLSLEKTYEPMKNILIVVDAGHGGHDTGARSAYDLDEKDVNLAIALKFGEQLKENGLDVLYTRDDDTFIPLYDRPKIANQAKATLFVSVHSNALPPKPQIRGTEVYYYNDYSLSFAQTVSNLLSQELPLPHRGVKRAGFVVIKYTRMPAILLEVAYLTNKEDTALLKDENFQELVAEKLSDAVLSYLEKYPPTVEERKSSKPIEKMETNTNEPKNKP